MLVDKITKKLFGTQDEREVKKMRKIVDKINAIEPQFQNYTDGELSAKTAEFKERLEKGETLDDILVEAFATVREAARRILGMRAYDVQLIGGMILHKYCRDENRRRKNTDVNYADLPECIDR